MGDGCGPPRPPPPLPNGHGRRPRPRAIEPLPSTAPAESSRPEAATVPSLDRPHTHSGVSLEVGTEDGATERPERYSCSSCCKLRLKLEHAERARVKAQEQLVRLQQEHLRMRQASGYGGADAPAAPPLAPAAALAADEEVARTLESYRREVAFLKQSLAEQKEQEGSLREELQTLRKEHAERVQALQGQLATLLLDLEAKDAS
eukprot:s3455_g3.t1